MATEEETTTTGGTTITTTTGTTDAQVIQDRDPDPSTIEVDEVEVDQDTVVTDLTSEDAVIKGEKGPLDLPLSQGTETPEEQLSSS